MRRSALKRNKKWTFAMNVMIPLQHPLTVSGSPPMRSPAVEAPDYTAVERVRVDHHDPSEPPQRLNAVDEARCLDASRSGALIGWRR